MTSRALSNLLFLALATSGCTNIAPIAAGICGNKIIEPDNGEDCDGGDNCGKDTAGLAACRIQCIDVACPDGWGCGTDQICRQHSGQFELVSEVDSITVFAQAGDMDGDGRLDLFRTSNASTEASFFADDFNIAATTTIERVPGFVPPLLAPMTFDSEGVPDKRQDIVLDYESASTFGSGLAVYQSQADRSLTPTAYSAVQFGAQNAFGIAVNALTPFSLDEVVGFVKPMNGAAGLIGLGDGDVQPYSFEVDAGVPLHPALLTGVAKGHLLDYGGTSDCEDVVWTAARVPGNENKVFIYSPCETDPITKESYWSERPTVEVIELDAPLHVADPPDPFLPDNYHTNVFVERMYDPMTMTNDGLADIVVVLESGDGKPIHFIKNPGDDTWSNPALVEQQVRNVALDDSYMDAETQVLLNVCVGEDGQHIGRGLPLAITDLNGDGQVDYVSDDAIWISQPNSGGGNYFPIDACLQWGTVVVDDFDANGERDIAATRLRDSGVDIALNSGDGALTRNLVSTQRPVFFLGSGDYDGDFVSDLSYLELQDTSSEATSRPTDTLWVAFGAASGGLETPISLGTLTEARGLVSGRIEGGDATDDILLVATSSTEELAIAIFSGNGARQIVSPFLLVEGEAMNPMPTEILEVTAGNFFSEEDTSQGLAVLTRTEEAFSPSLWALQVVGDAELLEEPTEIAKIDYCGVDCLLAAIDLDADGYDELVVLGTDGVRGLGKVYKAEVRAPAFFGDESDIEGVDKLCFSSRTLDNDPIRPVVKDVDGDGDEELGVFGWDCNTFEAKAAIFWNDGSGTLSLSRASIVRVDDDGEGTIGAIGFMNADGDPELELLVSVETAENFIDEDEGLNHVFDVSPGQSEVTFYDNGRLLELDEDDQYPAELYIPGDFNGDGVEDLIISSFESYSIFRGVPVR